MEEYDYNNSPQYPLILQDHPNSWLSSVHKLLSNHCKGVVRDLFLFEYSKQLNRDQNSNFLETDDQLPNTKNNTQNKKLILILEKFSPPGRIFFFTS